MIGEADNLDKLERDWASKILWVIRAYEKPTKQSLPLRVKDILAPLNRDYNYRYCFGNAAIADILKDLSTHRFNQQQSIKRLTDFGSAVSVIEAIKTLTRRREKAAENRMIELEYQEDTTGVGAAEGGERCIVGGEHSGGEQSSEEMSVGSIDDMCGCCGSTGVVGGSIDDM